MQQRLRPLLRELMLAAILPGIASRQHPDMSDGFV